MNNSVFEQYEIFKKMDPVKIQVMKELAEQMEGKALKDAARSLWREISMPGAVEG